MRFSLYSDDARLFLLFRSANRNISAIGIYLCHEFHRVPHYVGSGFPVGGRKPAYRGISGDKKRLEI